MNFMRTFSYSLVHLCGVVAAGDVDLALVQRTVNTYTLGALAQKQRQQHQLGLDFSTKGTMYTIQYKISTFKLVGDCSDGWRNNAELTAFGKVNGCSTGCVTGGSNGDANSWTKNGNWCENTINTTSPTLDLEFEAWEDDRGGRCDYNNYDDCHSKKKVTESLQPSTSWAEIKVRDSQFEMTVKYKLNEITPTPTPMPTPTPTPVPPTPMPTPTPTPEPPTPMPTPTPTPEPTQCTDASCQAYADPHVSGFDNENNVGPASLSLLSQRSLISRFVGKRPEDLNLNQTGDFWFVKNDMVHIQGRFAFSQEFAPDGAAIGAVAVGGPFLGGSVLLVEPLNGGVEWNGERVSCDEATSTIPLPGKREIQCSRDNMSDLAFEFPLSGTSCSNAALKMKINRFERHVDVKITMPPLPGGTSGECGNFNGLPEDDVGKSLEHRRVSVPKGETLFSP
jgi:hypothetical protein